MEDIKISVIIPSYKPKEYLWQCIDSMITQTINKEYFEVIIVLNGCCEPWKSDIENYIKNHGEGVNFVFLQTNTPGVSNARNIGIDIAKGEYITFIDDDDYVSPSYLEKLLPIAKTDTLALAYPYGFYDGKEDEQVSYKLTDSYNKYACKGHQPFQNVLAYFQGPCMKLFHRECIGNRHFDTRFANGEDSLFMFAISNKFKYVDFADKDCVYYRRHRPGSASRSQKSGQMIRNAMEILKVYHTIYRKKDGGKYSFRFYCTRVLGAFHTMLRAFI